MDKQKEALRLRSEGHSYRKIGSMLGTPKSTVFQWLEKKDPVKPVQTGPPKESFSESKTPDSTTINYTGTKYSSVEEMLIANGVDLDENIIVSAETKRWEVAMRGEDGEPKIVEVRYLSAKFKPKKIEFDIRSFISEKLSSLEKPSPVLKKPINDESERWAEICIMDAHLGSSVSDISAPWGRDEFIAAIDETYAICMDRIKGLNINGFLLPAGNDAIHFDNLKGTTTSGTPMENRVGTWFQNFSLICDTYQRIIDDLLAGGAYWVHVPCVPGNHDYQTVLSLAKFLMAVYAKDPRVTVEVGHYLYFKRGKVLLGFTHGSAPRDMVRLSNIMPTDVPEMWADAKVREWHVGHVHKVKEGAVNWDVDGAAGSGVRIRAIPSLTPLDNWSYTEGYRQAVRGCHMYIWEGDRLFAMFPVYLK